MAQGGKVMHKYREHYNPAPVTEVTQWTTSDLVILWVSGVAWGVVFSLLYV